MVRKTVGRFRLTVSALAAAAALNSCATMQPRDFARTTPVLDPLHFFTGSTKSTGVFEDRAGHPTKRFHTSCVGRAEPGGLLLDQTFRYDDGTTQQRQWHLRRVDAHHFEARAGDVIGVGRGEAYGSAFHWAYTVELAKGHPLSRVRLDHWMFLHRDGTLLNRAAVRFYGIRVGSVSEVFTREPQP